MKRLSIWMLALSMSGCAGGYLTMIEGLNQRQVESCIHYQGSMRAGRSLFSGHVAVSGVTATGGMRIIDCIGIGP